MKKQKIKLLLIDVDNTLLDFDAYVRQTMEQGFAHFGLRSYEPWMYDVFTVENIALWRRIEEGTLTFSELMAIRWNVIFRKLDILFDGPTFETYFRHALNESAIPVPGAYEMLEALVQDYTLCVASNGPTFQQMNRLELADMAKYFTYFFISEELGASKPSREFFERAFRIMNDGRAMPILPGECVMVGDSMTSDMAGGRNYGMKTCFYRRKETDSAPMVDLIADHLTDIPSLLKTLS